MAEKKSTPVKQDEKVEMVFTKKNYQLYLIAIAIVLLGFILMIGTTGDIYDTRRTLISPMIVLFGFGFGLYAKIKD